MNYGKIFQQGNYLFCLIANIILWKVSLPFQSNYENGEKGDYDISIVGVNRFFFEDIEKKVENGLYKKYEAIDDNGNIELCTKKAWKKVWDDTDTGTLKRAFTIDYESSVPAEYTKDGKAHCYLYISVKK